MISTLQDSRLQDVYIHTLQPSFVAALRIDKKWKRSAAKWLKPKPIEQ